MKRIFVYPAIIFLVCAILIGAQNQFREEKDYYRPFTFTESLEAFKDLKFEFTCVESFAKGFSKHFEDYKNREDPSDSFGQPGYIPNTGIDTVDKVLKALSDAFTLSFSLVYLFLSPLFLLLNALADILILIVNVLWIPLRFIIGVPVNPTT